MSFRLIFFLLLVSYSAWAQSLANENLTHLYDPRDEIDFKWIMVKQGNEMKINYSLISSSTNTSPDMYLMKWEERASYSQRQGKSIKIDSVLLASNEVIKGNISIPIKEEPWMLQLKIVKVTDSKTWSYPFLVEKNYPVNGFVQLGNQIVLEPYLKTGQPYTVESSINQNTLYGFLYSKRFESAFPPFSKSTPKTDPLLLPDSTFTISSGSSITFEKEGLYLFQSDTSSAEGFAYRVSAGSYPKYTRVQDLIMPMVFICTTNEFNDLLASNGDKVTFDKTVLSITRDKDRAKRFMRSYYSRVELANRYFTSYKEGWKTDKGMIFTIFGLPDEIRKTSQNEIWYYKGSRTKFVFVKKGSVYDPDYYIMIRDDRFTSLWYNAVDLWRKSRF